MVFVPGFDLFISYFRRDSRQKFGDSTVDLVDLFKRELEAHRVTREDGRTSRFRVCTDTEDFTLGETFDAVMRERIGSSRAFLLVCSPGIVSSPYVRREIDIFRDLFPNRRPLAALLGGKPHEIFPEFFSAEEVIADLVPAIGATRTEMRAVLRRESHKLVAQALNQPVSQVFDRFVAQQRTVRRRIAGAGIIATLTAAGLVIGLAGNIGYHRSLELPTPHPLVSPAGVGYADDGSSPVVIRDRIAYTWNAGAESKPAETPLAIDGLYAVAAGPGRMFVAGVDSVGLLDIASPRPVYIRKITGEVSGITSYKTTSAVSTKTGSLEFIDETGTVTAAPRPNSVAGRRFPAFRDTGPFVYGEVLALNDHYLASATYTGRLGVLDLAGGNFIIPADPQFQLAEPIDHPTDPILYETENTRPISSMAFLPDGDLLFDEGAGLRRVDPHTGKITFLKHCNIELVRQLMPLPDGKRIVALTSSTIELLRFDDVDPTRLNCISRTSLAPKSSPRATLEPDGRTIVIAYFDAPPEVWAPSFQLFGWQLRLPGWLW